MMENNKKEVRLVEMRALEDDGMTVEGYAAVFDIVTDLGWMKEVIDRKAFDNADMSDIVMKYNHENCVLPMALIFRPWSSILNCNEPPLVRAIVNTQFS